MGERVVVVGGGNVALDVARTALRTAIPGDLVGHGINIVTALDVARSAIRFGVREVHVVSLESMEDMPSDPEEMEQASEEGVLFHPGRGPHRILGEDGKVVGLETIRCASVFDEQHRFNPVFTDGTELAMAADTVILAIGQTSDLSFLAPEDGIRILGRLAHDLPGVLDRREEAFEIRRSSPLLDSLLARRRRV